MGISFRECRLAKIEKEFGASNAVGVPPSATVDQRIPSDTKLMRVSGWIERPGAAEFIASLLV